MLAKYQPNCSETAYEVPKNAIDSLPENEKKVFFRLLAEFCQESTPGYCSEEIANNENREKNYYGYYYQGDSVLMQAFLEKHKIEYNMSEWLTYQMSFYVESKLKENDIINKHFNLECFGGRDNLEEYYTDFSIISRIQQSVVEQMRGKIEEYKQEWINKEKEDLKPYYSENFDKINELFKRVSKIVFPEYDSDNNSYLSNGIYSSEEFWNAVYDLDFQKIKESKEKLEEGNKGCNKFGKYLYKNKFKIVNWVLENKDTIVKLRGIVYEMDL